MLNKSFLTNILTVILSLSFFLTVGKSHPLYQGAIFAFSGALTNWLAVYMLFEKIPFIYGSGVIPSRFEEFKLGIKDLVMNQFFTVENLEKFLTSENENSGVDLQELVGLIDEDEIFQKILKGVEESNLGPMLSMFGGVQALSSMKEPMMGKLKEGLVEVLEKDHIKDHITQKMMGDHPDQYLKKIESVIEKRLEELTPKLVKEIIQEMIREHLGWLVVWGGVFGFIFGVVNFYL
jgi:uncharacterized membrane protein YheB (UPF0754 family)